MYAKVRKSDKKVVLKEGSFLRLVKKGYWEFAERHNCKGIVIVMAVTSANKLIFVEQYRPPVEKKCIEFPAGLVNDLAHTQNESFKSAAKRELFEETGYRAERFKRVYRGPSAAGSSADLVVIMQAFGLKKEGDGGGDHLEDIRVHEVPVAKVHDWLLQMQKRGRYIEPKIYTGLYWLHHYNKVSSK